MGVAAVAPISTVDIGTWLCASGVRHITGTYVATSGRPTHGGGHRDDTDTLGKGTATFATQIDILCTNARAESIWKMVGATGTTHAIPHAVLASTEGEMLGSHRVCGKVKKSKVVQSQRGGGPYTVPDTGGGDRSGFACKREVDAQR